jgi:hypothetical protein
MSITGRVTAVEVIAGGNRSGPREKPLAGVKWSMFSMADELDPMIRGMQAR